MGYVIIALLSKLSFMENAFIIMKEEERDNIQQ